MEQLIEKIKPFAELLDNLNPYAQTYLPEWKEKFEQISEKQAGSLDKILLAFEQGSPANLPRNWQLISFRFSRREPDF